MVLRPLEFSDCLTDSPYFRESIKAHEQEVEESHDGIKELVKASRKATANAREYSKVNSSFAQTLMDFNFRGPGADGSGTAGATETENMIGGALHQFGELMQEIEQQRTMMLDQCPLIVSDPLENFRKVEIGAVREEKKRFDKQAHRYYEVVEKVLSMSVKRKEDAVGGSPH